MMQRLTIDPELARQLKEAAAAGRFLAVVINDRAYRLSITPAAEVDFWKSYEPEGVREAVRRSAALSSTADTAELNALVAEIRAQRDQAPDDFHSQPMLDLLDSDILIYYTNGVMSIHEMIERIAPDGLAVSAVSYKEAQQGIMRSQNPGDAQIRLDELLTRTPLITFDRAETRHCASLRETVQRQGKRIRQRALDLMIATTALEHDLTLVTNNPSDYSDLPRLLVEAPLSLQPETLTRRATVSRNQRGGEPDADEVQDEIQGL